MKKGVNWKKVIYSGLAVLMFAGAAGLTGYFFWANGFLGPVEESTPSTTFSDFTYPSLDQIDNILPSQTQEGDPAVATDETQYVSPIDFDALHAVNPDVVGWLYMENPAISLPIMQDPADNTFYLYHNIQREYDRNGSLFIEDYNNSDFNDMCTIIYGHRMSTGNMFGTMQATFSDPSIFDESQYIVIYLPNSQKIYQICATIPRDSSHILYYNDFDDQTAYEEFIDSVYATTGVDVNLLEDLRPEYGDRLLILSTCLWGDRTNRYLIIAKEISD